MTLPLGALDDRIELRGWTGSGAMGEVYRAWDDQLDRAVAVKFQLAADDREAERLLLEARLQARVEHPNVVKVHEVGTLKGRVCIVFQLVDGPSLGELAPQLRREERVELLRQAATGLHASHLQGLVHRDVKPGNVLVEEGLDGKRRALLGDFGLARAEEGGLSRTGVPVGTLEYMSPEQLLGNGPVDFRSDIYGLGATLYGLLAGRPPFRSSAKAGGEEESSGLFRRVLEEEPEPLHRAAPGTPRELGLVAVKAMEKSPDERYATAEAFAEDLGRFLAGEPVQAQPHSLLERTVKWARRNRTAARAMGGTAIVILLAAGFAVWTSRRASQEALEAARVGADAEWMESTLRNEELLPAHDLTPAYEEIRAAMNLISQRATGVGAAPAAFGLGRGHQLLGENMQALTELRRGWSLGYRGPEVARALGEVEAARYAEEIATLPRFDDPDRKQQRVEALQLAWRDPALERLRVAASAGGPEGDLVAARIALVEERFDEAVALAVRAKVGRYTLEAAEIEATAHIMSGLKTFDVRDAEGTMRALDAADLALRTALDIGRSAPSARVLQARIALLRSKGLFSSPPAADVETQSALSALDEAMRLGGRGADISILRSEVEVMRAKLDALLGRDPVPAARRAVAAGEAAVALVPGSLLAWQRLTFAYYSLAIASENSEGSHLPLLEKGIRAGERSVALGSGASESETLLPGLYGRKATRLEEVGEDGRPAAAQGVAVARRLVEIANRPYIAQLIASEAFTLRAKVRRSHGEPAWDDLEEGYRLASRALTIAPRSMEALGFAIFTAEVWAEAEVSEGRDPSRVLRETVALIEPRLEEIRKGSLWSGQAGEVFAQLAQVEMAAGRDPSEWVERAAPLLLQAADGSQGTANFFVALGDLARVRAAWARARGRASVPIVREALSYASRVQRAQPTSADAFALEARILLDVEHPDAGQVERARSAARKAIALDASHAPACVLLARAEEAAGDPAAARAALALAEGRNPRLVGIAELRQRLGK